MIDPSTQREGYVNDPWLGESEVDSYDPSDTKVWLASSDKRGHRSVVRVNVPADLPGEIAAIVAKVSEFRTSHDFIRDVLVRGINYWRKRVPELELSDWGGQFLRLAQAEDYHERVQAERDLVAKYKSLLNDTSDMPMMRQEILMRMRSFVPALNSESLRRECESILSFNPIFTDEL